MLHIRSGSKSCIGRRSISTTPSTSRARREGKSLAAVIREILEGHSSTGRDRPPRDSLSQVIGIAEGDGSRVAKHYEDDLYGGDS